MRYVIVGGGIAALSALKTIRSIDRDGEIILVSEENQLTYSRVLISHYLAGHIAANDLWLVTPEQIEALKVSLLLGKKVVRVIPSSREVLLNNGERLSYDRLLLATGASAVMPSWAEGKIEGVYPLRTLADAENIALRAREKGTAVVVGGGFVSIKAACALADRDVPVKMIVSSKQILSQAMDGEAAQLVKEKLEAKGIEILLDCDVKSLESSGESLTGVVLSSGELLPCRLLVVGKGVVPNVNLASEAGIETDRGILVNQYMQTSIETIYAAGDVAQAYDFLTGTRKVNAIWPCAVEQGQAAGKNMAGCCYAYAGGIAMNTINIDGFVAINLGITRPSPDSGISSVIYRSQGVYKKLFLKEGVLQGVLLVGDVKAAGLLYSLIRKGIDVSAWVDRLTDQNLSYGKVYARLMRKCL